MTIAETAQPAIPTFDFGDGSDSAVLEALWSFAAARGLIQACSTDTILSAFDVGFNVQFDPDERRFRQKLLYVLLDDAGCVFYDDFPIESADSLVGLSIDAIKLLSFPLQIAVLDSLYSTYFDALQYDKLIRVAGSHRRKALERTGAICDEVALVRDTYFGQSSVCTVSLIGVSRLQARMLSNQGFSIRAWDNDPGYAGHAILPGVVVNCSESAETQLSGADIALISGMTIGNNSLTTILEESKRLGVKSVCWAVTASKLAPLFRHLGLTSAVCEGFPPYFLPGETNLKIFRDDEFRLLTAGHKVAP